MLSARHPGGFTLIELLVGLALLAILLVMGAPAMGTYLHNAKLAAATGSYYTGVQMARTEAIRRNLSAQFVLTDTPLTIVNLENAAVPNLLGRSWIVRAPSPVAGVFLPVIDKKDATEGEVSIVAPSIVVTSAGPVGYTGIIAFNGFGATADGQPYSIDISNPAAGVCAPVGPVRCRRITIAPGGQISACDPAAAAGDSRAC